MLLSQISKQLGLRLRQSDHSPVRPKQKNDVEKVTAITGDKYDWRGKQGYAKRWHSNHSVTGYCHALCRTC
ncbi:hypothetical protein GCM10010911_59870 [Paenibacillus nasutitermitis]|uniref:Uncharacterized protein n=1 Tax=Paenibacillus nasutitermitis TaxID=1652958 RepID=A0A916ZF79_9BACL|nr:hypothetical protein GCM10010911_59870 [Paenibacillus nasutitermitis]